MAHVRFSRAFDHRPDPRTVVAYPAEFEGEVPTAHAKAAIRAGAAARVKAPQGAAVERPFATGGVVAGGGFGLVGERR